MSTVLCLFCFRTNTRRQWRPTSPGPTARHGAGTRRECHCVPSGGSPRANFCYAAGCRLSDPIESNWTLMNWNLRSVHWQELYQLDWTEAVWLEHVLLKAIAILPLSCGANWIFAIFSRQEIFVLKKFENDSFEITSFFNLLGPNYVIWHIAEFS